MWFLAHVQNLSFILSTAYIPPNADEEFGDFFLSLDEARHYSVANKLSCIIFVGDINARSSLWGDTRNNTCFDLLEVYIEELMRWLRTTVNPRFALSMGNLSLI